MTTLAWPDWIEQVFGVEPDGGSGALEWVIVGALLAATALFSLLGRREWQQLQAAEA